MKAVFTGRASANLREIARYIAKDNPKRALSFTQELRREAKKLGDMPLAFPVVFVRQTLKRGDILIAIIISSIASKISASGF